MLQIKLVDNALTPDPTDFRAMVVNYSKKSVEEVVKQIAVPGSILKETECEAVIKKFFQVLAENLRQGVGFDSEFITITQHVSGVFTSEADAFDPTRHEVTLTVKTGQVFQQALNAVDIAKVDHVLPRPTIRQVFDTKSRTSEKCTSGHLLDIQGNLLKVENETDPAQGVFLVSAQKEKEVRVAYIHHNGSKKLQVEVPEGLKSGEKYRLEIRSTVKGSKDIRIGMYEKVLTVA